MNLRLTSHLFGRLVRGRRLVGTCVLAAVAGLVAWVSMLGQSQSEAQQIFYEITASVPAGTLSIAVLLLATAVLRDERDGGTLPFLFVSPVSRIVFASSAWAAAAGASVLVATAGWLVAFAGAGFVLGSWTIALPALGTYVAAAIAYSSLFVPLGYLFSRSLLVGLGYVFVWEGIIASFVPGVSGSSVWRVALTIYADVAQLPRDALDVLGSMEPGVGGAVVTVAVVTVLGIGVLDWAMRHRDAV